MDDALNLLVIKIVDYLKDIVSADNDGHGFDHLYRVMKYSRFIQSQEGGDITVLVVSSLLHDAHRWIKNDNGDCISPTESIDYLLPLLKTLSLSHNQIEKVCSAIGDHETYNFGVDTISDFPIETKILQDADNLDAIGAVGVIRTFRYGVIHGIPDFLPQIPLTQKEEYKDDEDPSTIHHIYNKLVRITDVLYTSTARKLALARMDILINFFKQFIEEWTFKDE